MIFLPGSGIIAAYTDKDGVVSNEFNQGEFSLFTLEASLISPSAGNVYLGLVHPHCHLHHCFVQSLVDPVP
jgi:hypothetical protein